MRDKAQRLCTFAQQMSFKIDVVDFSRTSIVPEQRHPIKWTHQGEHLEQTKQGQGMQCIPKYQMPIKINTTTRPLGVPWASSVKDSTTLDTSGTTDAWESLNDDPSAKLGHARENIQKQTKMEELRYCRKRK
ncbi:hypothetical protein CHS0354_014616 [Potamilus streckersoni]|uniref:Uncharacterized protein n=1 Tax=Potamilus streckersoni TaxID=2493646 RepID=A0AAE0SPZ5_9BIVA|nr:hypothetical protein CHS0354_014616 [Potamilus streckersoni]